MLKNDLLTRIRGEFLEMPGLRLTLEQAQRLCGVAPALCKTVLDSLVDANFLCIRPDGAYARSIDGDVARPNPLKAGLGPDRRKLMAS
jgi:hypothetical protein